MLLNKLMNKLLNKLLNKLKIIEMQIAKQAKDCPYCLYCL